MVCEDNSFLFDVAVSRQYRVRENVLKGEMGEQKIQRKEIPEISVKFQKNLLVTIYPYL